MKSKVIVFSNQKGGVAKTTSAIMTAANMISRNYKVLIVDADPQCNSSNFMVEDFDDISDTHDTLFELIFDEELDIKESIIKNTAFGDVIIGSRKLWDMDRADTDPRVLKEIIDEVREDYDYVIIDTPPHLGWLQIASLTAADYVVVPTDADNMSVQNIPYLYNTIQNVKNTNEDLSIAGILFTRVETRGSGLRVEKQIINDMYEYAQEMNINVFDTKIRAAKTPLGESSLTHQNIFMRGRKHKVKEDYNQFVSELLEVIR